MRLAVENTRKKQLAWVNAILAHKGWKPANLAKQAGFDQSTISRFLRDRLNKAQLNSGIVQKIAAVGGIPPYQLEPTAVARGFAETEAEPWQGMPGDPLLEAVSHWTHGHRGVDPWVMRSRALEHAGVVPGDILIVDLNAIPADGDTVCAQLYDRSGQAETAFRIYEKPFLVAACSDAALRRPVLIDGERAAVRGVVVASLRGRTG